MGGSRLGGKEVGTCRWMVEWFGLRRRTGDGVGRVCGDEGVHRFHRGEGVRMMID